ncbi:MAG: tRNA pseudouridine(38-40) synthase TruA [Candidatus Cloacimonadaceae bacterium]
MRYLIKIQYDGTNFIGWQKQASGRSIQGTMEKALAQFSDTEASITAAGRTDAGVHALGQYAHFEYTGKMQEYQILKAFSRWLPNDIKVAEITPVSDALSARYQAYEREYLYILAKEADPFRRNYSGYVPQLRAHLKPMQAAAPYFLGKWDFSSFGRFNPEVPNPICELKELEITEDDFAFRFSLKADRFLHNMVRRIVGTLINISHFGLKPETVSQLLEDKNPRQRLVFTVPASGLCLINVKYPEELLKDCKTYKYADITRGKHEL